MKRMIFIMFLLLISNTLYSQELEVPKASPISETGKHAIHGDLGTLIFWGFASINYEIQLKQKPGKSITRFRTGYLYRFDDHFYGLPLGLTMLYGESKKYFELNLGIIPTYHEEWIEDMSISGAHNDLRFMLYPLINIGYRWEPGKDQPFFRIQLGSSGLGFGLGYNF